MNTTELNLTPKDIVERLDRYIVGQDDAKKAVAIALRNRYRRLQLSADMQKEITPKNILMIGPTGVGKTEIARRLADIVNAPFVKLEATKFTEVGYVGRDVESMVRDLVENAVHLVREQKRQEVRGKAQQQAIKRVAKALAPSKKDTNAQQAQNPFASLFQGAGGNPQQQMANLFGGGAPDVEEDVSEEIATKRKDLVNQIERGVLDSREVDIMVEEKKQTPNNPMSQQMEQMGIDLSSLGSLGPQKKVKRTVTVKEAVDIFTDEEADKLINTEDINSEAIQLAENNGIIFLDEIDKITVREQQGGGNGQVSREGVQRDILPIVEGSTVRTKYGTLKTDHVLFIGSGAFHMSKPSDLIPELQGRFPIRVELNDLTKDNFVQILTEPKNALIEQYKALIGTENVDVIFTMESIERIAEIAFEVNENTDNIGARRLHTIVEKLLEELLFESPSMQSGEVKITEKYVDEKIGEIATNTDLSRYIL
ncbi:ATP-dependent protease ATP-binding subunit HslU [Dolosigranulum pigrum]|jgi:ATP-dependent protease hslVU, ATPase subunit|uniref:ATP-dependent protease ATPase subunit HslU n=3 Tax=Dolosigranulum pigrum TaxID=29394 RepID=H3NES1_9LACT|nr:ATP-dependent protease ATPase subunit HslU [Dolosigranulum pigrum]EHR32936.1 ATP-dependent protease HslVU, ATPase subunit [Dolosigranulum pigrum ATCC 51524]QDO91445.1 ATP-dependent protease ATPase subunit HslU [Dolosigranulum pigrum]QJS96483.1 ATP-dependent protease ATPase subunit HslU [Dolosigranulum pigrum]QJS98288.1 ATP-dependent protease ATPase subunit HslU [Dolosigranulum pigrum]QTJ32870.1 ATP-dependent protease ATPase subunit HslU [Dolosigranulum pigrum]